MLAEKHTLWQPVTEDDKKQVRQQLERLLETSHFRNSRRYPALFRFIVEETLAGRGGFLKERLIGIQVFGRSNDYDTATDPVVRVTVAEIRKRIAQYYHDEERGHELRIELLPGRYGAEFRVSRDLEPDHGAQDLLEIALTPVQAIPLPEAESSPIEVVTPHTSLGMRRKKWPWVLAATAILMIAAVSLWFGLRPGALKRFWSPLLAAHQPVLICLPVAGGKYGVAASSKIILPSQLNSKPPAENTGSYLALESLGENVVFSDVRAMTRLSDLLTQYNVERRLRLNTAVTLDDLRQGPAVLIGALDNPWTLRAISHMRYQFGGSDEETYWIADTRTGQPTAWSLDLKKPITSVTRDFAIIARVHAEDTGEPQVVVGGIGMSGTAAAGELLTNPAQMEALRQRVGPGFDNRDFEAVISTDVVNGIAGPPQILTVEIQ